jgi:SagB-type dehydrogenase family enzyme
MKTREFLEIAVFLVFGMGLLAPAFGQEMKPIKLPQPELTGGKTLMQALKDRSTSRKYAAGDISQQTLSNLLWAAFGISRPETGKRTAPSAYNRQEIDVYVAMAKGLYLYNPKENSLKPVVSKDLRLLTGKQSYFNDAALNLVYVADLSKMGEGEEQGKMYIAGTDTGFIGQNVYLFCASEGLATVFRASIDRKKLGEAMKLKPNQRITFAQTVGLPASGK